MMHHDLVVALREIETSMRAAKEAEDAASSFDTGPDRNAERLLERAIASLEKAQDNLREARRAARRAAREILGDDRMRWEKGEQLSLSGGE